MHLRPADAATAALPEHDVVFVGSGREGIWRLDAGERFDLIFCDVMLPDLTGRDVHEQIGERDASMLAIVTRSSASVDFEQYAAEGVTEIDISTTGDSAPDWGIFGPIRVAGSTAVISKIVERVAERFAASKADMKFLCAALDVPC